MFNVGGGEIVVILLIALIVLGPDKLPSAARQVGKYLNEFRRISSGFQDEIRSAMDVATQTSTDAPPADPTPQYQPPVDPTPDPTPEPYPGPPAAAEPTPEAPTGASDPTPTTPDADPGPADPSAA